MTFAVALDFSTKQERTVTLDDVNDARARGSYCWIDLHAPSDDELRKFLESLKIGHEPIDEIAEFDRRPAFNVYSKCLHFTLAEARMVDGSFQTVTLHVVVGDGFLVTVHQQELEMLHRTRKTYSEGFQTAALSPGFLLFELADHLAYVCGHTLTMFEDQIEEIEAELFGKADDDIFLPVSELIRSLLQFRKAVVASREVIHELATRRSPFVSETTQPYLEKKSRAARTVECRCHDRARSPFGIPQPLHGHHQPPNQSRGDATNHHQFHLPTACVCDRFTRHELRHRFAVEHAGTAARIRVFGVLDIFRRAGCRHGVVDAFAAMVLSCSIPRGATRGL